MSTNDFFSAFLTSLKCCIMVLPKQKLSQIFVFLFFCSPVPDQAGGPAASNERSACQSVRAAGHSCQGSGAGQPQTGAGQPPGPAEDPEVSLTVS